MHKNVIDKARHVSGRKYTIMLQVLRRYAVSYRCSWNLREVQEVGPDLRTFSGRVPSPTMSALAEDRQSSADSASLNKVDEEKAIGTSFLIF